MDVAKKKVNYYSKGGFKLDILIRTKGHVNTRYFDLDQTGAD